MKEEVKKTRSAGGVVLNKDGDVLVVSQHGITWSLPKGHIEGKEDALSAAKREIFEESGINDIEFVKELGTYTRPKITKYGIGDDVTELKTITIFLCKTKQNDLKPQDKDNPEAIWVKKDEVAKLLSHPKDKEFFLSVYNQIV